MPDHSWRSWAAGATATFTLTASVLAISASPAAATVACPTVDSATGAVSPLPEPVTDWSGCDLAGADLASAPMTQDDLSGANLTGADLDSADVDTVNFTGADLHEATLTSADLDTANLTNADLSAADLSGAFLNDAVLTGADVDGTNLSGTSLDPITSGGLTGDPALMPTGFTLDNGYLIGPGSILNGADLSGLNLDHLDLDGDSLAGANLDDASLAGVDVQNGSFANATLINANLAGANLAGVSVAGADFTGASLHQVSSGGVTGQPLHLPANWFVVGPNGYLVGPGADLDQANLVEASMAGADLADANLTGAQLSLVNLKGADLQNADLADVDATDTDLAGANLAGASLQHAAIDGAALQLASMSSANLTDATIEQSDLRGAILTGATLTGITWTDTTCPDGSNSDAVSPGACTAALAAPVASPAVTSGTHGADGWYTSAVTVAWNWTDNSTTIPAACPVSSTTAGNGDPVTLKASCTDLDGTTGTGVFSAKVDRTRPSVSISGPRGGAVYPVGHVPAAGCVTSEKISGVGQRASASTHDYGPGGLGAVTLTCSGARSAAGLSQAAPASVTYAVASGFGGFTGPKPGSILSKSAPVAVGFRLTAAAARPIAAGTAAALAKAHMVQATLRGPGITATTAVCGWNAKAKTFTCQIKVPRGVKTGTGVRYTITAAENFGHGFLVTPAGKSANPEVIHFS